MSLHVTLSIYNRALTANEIQAVYNADSAGKCPVAEICSAPASGLVSWWPLDEISGTPTTVGISAFTVQVTDDQGQIETRVFYLDIGSAIDILTIITESPLPDGVIGVPYEVTLEAEGGVPPYSWSIISGELPPGLTLNSVTGVISGTPTEAGTFGFTVQVTDSYGDTDTGSFTLARPASSGNTGSTYTNPVVITDPDPGGGGQPVACNNYAVVSGDLPDGLNLDPVTGIISGTPTTPGIYDFTVECVIAEGGSQGQTATREFTITIYDPLPTLISLDPNEAIAGGEYFVLTLNGTNFVNGSLVHWNGSSRPTTYVSDIQLTAQITAADIATEGAASVTVVNPDPGGGTSNALNFTINPPQQPPTANANGPYSCVESSDCTFDGSSSYDPDPGDSIVLYEWDLNYDGATFDVDATGVQPTVNFVDNFPARSIALRVTDSGGLTGLDDSTTIEVINADPSITEVTNDGPIDEGSSATVTVSATDPAGANDPLSYQFDCDNDLTYEVGPQADNSSSCGFGDNGSFQVNVRVTDGDGGEALGATTVTVRNVGPSVGPIIIVPESPVLEVGTSINASAGFTDPGVLDTHTAIWEWGDGSDPTVIEITDGSRSVSGDHTYTQAGVYTVKLTVTDKDGDFDESVYQFVVIYDPDGGFVTGGGWIDSPEGACRFDACTADTTGKATFGFVSKYKKGADVPTGNTEFQFKAGNLSFRSTSYQWLVVAGPKAQFKGEGTINGEGNYGFMLTAIDEELTPSTDVDMFRIKIWDIASEDTVYDNQMGESEDSDAATSIGGGSIVIHKDK